MIKRITLKNIRTFENSSFDFQEGINVIVGGNGAGKTTLLESIGLFAFGKFLSIDQDSQAVRTSQKAGRIEAEFENGSVDDASVGVAHREKVIEIGGRKVHVSNLIGLQPQIFFNPESVDIVGGSPVLRRRELDVMILEIDHKFVADMLNYKRVLKERNMLLRRTSMGSAKRAELEFWDDKFVKFALSIYKKRQELIDFYNLRINERFKELSNKDRELSLKYLPSCNYERFAEVLVAKTENDSESGSTSVGPHRDDFAFMFSQRPMREGASRGEQRLAAVAYKALSRECLLEYQIDPIIVLDDVFSELDEQRRESVAKTLNLSDAKQVMISVTDEKVLPESLIRNAHIIKLI